MSEEVWSARDTSPSAIEAALRELLGRRYKEDRAFVPARVMNLVVIVDRSFRGEVENRLARVGRYHPSRLVIAAVEDDRTQLDAWATVAAEDAVHQPGHIAVGRERVEVDIGPQHLDSLDSIVDPLLVPDLATMVWAPHGHAAGVDALRRLANIVLIDSQDEPEVRAAFERAADLTGSAYVVDLAWLRSTPWRERVAATFDPPPMRPRARRDRQGRRAPQDGLDRGRRAVLRLAGVAARLAPGGPGPARRPARRATPARAAARSRWSCTRRTWARPGWPASRSRWHRARRSRSTAGPAGCARRGARATAREQAWTVLGASRGESGILGEGVRQALLRDPTYGPALEAGRVLVG